MRLRAITWNLFHGRDAPPDRALHTWRSRVLRVSERNDTHVQVNRGLLLEFTGLLGVSEWDVALLQECPPAWTRHLADATGAEAHRVLTSRNSLAPLRSLLARLNPDLIASNEGGSNTTLVRSGPGIGRAEGPGLRIAEKRELVIRDGPPERRTMAFTRLAGGLCIANLHATNDRPDLAAPEVELAARTATDWAGRNPLIFGGDFNLRPRESAVFDLLDERLGLSPPTGPGALDHLLARGLELIEGPRAWPDEAREVPAGGLVLRLSDHAPVEALFEAQDG